MVMATQHLRKPCSPYFFCHWTKRLEFTLPDDSQDPTVDAEHFRWDLKTCLFTEHYGALRGLR